MSDGKANPHALNTWLCHLEDGCPQRFPPLPKPTGWRRRWWHLKQALSR